MARQLSFSGVSFKIEEIPLVKPFIAMYNESVKLVRNLATLVLKERSGLLRSLPSGGGGS